MKSNNVSHFSVIAVAVLLAFSLSACSGSGGGSGSASRTATSTGGGTEGGSNGGTDGGGSGTASNNSVSTIVGETGETVSSVGDVLDGLGSQIGTKQPDYLNRFNYRQRRGRCGRYPWQRPH